MRRHTANDVLRMNNQWADNERNMARRSGECGGASFQSRDAPAPKASGCPRRSRAAKRSQEAARLGKVASFSVSPEGMEMAILTAG